jgi:hypothetical protein
MTQLTTEPTQPDLPFLSSARNAAEAQLPAHLTQQAGTTAQQQHSRSGPASLIQAALEPSL